MPIYVYQCEQCELRFDKMQRFSEDPLKECPECGGPVHRVIQPVGVIFKGSGFYVTDNRTKSSTMPPSKKDEDGKPEKSDSLAKPADKPKSMDTASSSESRAS